MVQAADLANIQPLVSLSQEPSRDYKCSQHQFQNSHEREALCWRLEMQSVIFSASDD